MRREDDQPVSARAAPASCSCILARMPMSSSVLKASFLAVELQQHALAGLRALAGDACRSIFVFAASTPKHARLPRAAVVDFQRGQRS